MKSKRILTLIIGAVAVAAVIAIAVAAITSGTPNQPQDPLNNMVKALNALDFNGYVNTLHPALRADARRGMESGSEATYMHALRSSMLSQYATGSKIELTVIASYPLDSKEMADLKASYREQGYDISIDEAMLFYYYSIRLPDGSPDAPDETIVVRSGNTWYLVG